MVLFRYDPKYMTEKYVSDRADAALLESVVFDREYWDLLDRGEITDEKAKSEIKSRLPERLHAAAETIFDNWIGNLILIDGIEAVLAEIRTMKTRLYVI